MKKYLTGLILLLVVISCNTKKEELPIAPVPDVSYVFKPVGVRKGVEYSVGKDSVTYKWAAGAKKILGLSDSISFSDFNIVKVKTQGEAKESCYLLMAKFSGKPGAIASVLHLEEDVFYFDRLEEGGNTGVQVIICKGSCGEEACYPIVVVNDKRKKLICSTCTECDKNVSLIY